MTNSIFHDPKLIEEINKNSRKKTFLKDEIVVSSGSEIIFVPLVISGSIRIVRQDLDGREVFLYHLNSGQTCAMSLNCCSVKGNSMIKAISETESEILQLPANLIEEWFKYPEWRAFINNTYATRFTELLQVIDMIAFNNMDKQLLNYLSKRAEALNSKALLITHQQIADELHTQREVISRLLRTMEQKELVKLGRNIIELI
ncbi:MAG: Crp/Fnr family transcriptional regulator [Bacteroidota bacterium]